MNLPQSLRPEVPELSVNTAEVNFLSKTQKKQTPLWRQDTRTQGLNGTTTRTTIDSTGGTGVLTAIRSTQHAARSRRTHHTSELTNMIGVVANLSYLHTPRPVSRDTLFGMFTTNITPEESPSCAFSLLPQTQCSSGSRDGTEFFVTRMRHRVITRGHREGFGGWP